MIHREKCIVMDVDGTLCAIKAPDESYADVAPRSDVIAMLREYKARGFYIILSSSRNMNTHDGNIGVINVKTARTMLDWLERHDVPHDEVHFAKPWSGKGGFYVDDKSIRPNEFVTLSYDEIMALVGGET